MTKASEAPHQLSAAPGASTIEKPSEDQVAAVSTDNSTCHEDDDHDFGDGASMPLLQYSRMTGSLPRVEKREGSATNPLATACTCSKLGRVLVTREDTTDAAQQHLSNQLREQPQYVVIVGHQDGTLSLVDLESGHAIIPSDQLKVQENTVASSSSGECITDVSLDATSNFFAAVNAVGTCAIWEVKYAPLNPPRDPAPAEENNVFASFLTTLAGQSAQSTSSTNDQSSTSSLMIKPTSVQVSRINYPTSYGRPTCLKLDPSYKRRREKALLVGFEDGRLVLTKRGFVFQRRNDAVIFQGTSSGPSYRGIEAIEWRGALVAWADESGIKLFDVESMTRIAHVDRPAGARASLYPTISSLKPSLCFETKDRLLVAWADCVMAMDVKETIVNRPTPTTPEMSGTAMMAGLQSGGGTAAEVATATVVKKRKVECSMAWQLDCVACGVAPLDQDHVAVVGLFPFEEDEVDNNDGHHGRNDVEVQIISRAAGNVTYADALPILKLPSQFVSSAQGIVQESAVVYNLLSTFALARMEDNVEAEEEGSSNLTDPDFDFSLFAGNSKASFIDSHLRWDLSALEYDDVIPGADERKDDDSDDYGFLLRSTTRTNESLRAPSIGPTMIVANPADLVKIQPRTRDDAVSHAYHNNRIGLALYRGLLHKRELRKYDMLQLVDDFLNAVLRIKTGTDVSETTEEHELSIHRLEIAAKSTPVLLGGSRSRWEQWVNEFSRIPGGLFVLCKELPVRDPKLPVELYDKVLGLLLQEIEELLPKTNDEKASSDVVDQAIDRFLWALRCWGPSHALRERIQFLQSCVGPESNQKSSPSHARLTSELDETRNMLSWRLTQSASGYLELPSVVPESSAPPEIINVSAGADSILDGLFNADSFADRVGARVPVLSKYHQSEADFDDIAESSLNSRVALDALADLCIMSTKYEMALRCYLAIGSLYPLTSMEVLEKSAVEKVNKGSVETETYLSRGRYGFVMGMIEHHHIHSSLLDPEFLPLRDEDSLCSPLIALIHLVGLNMVGDFLVLHAVPPYRGTYGSKSSSASSVVSGESDTSLGPVEGNEALPMNFVAEQLQSNSALLHWYLNLLFKKKPEIYVNFPTTAVPPKAVTEVHRAHLELHMEFAEDRNSALSLEGTANYDQERKTTPLLLFLQSALPLGGIRPDEVRSIIESKRQASSSSVVAFPHSFAIELAYVVENYGDESHVEALDVLDLYLKGARSVTLAAAYAQRNKKHSETLWSTLIKYCLKGGETDDEDDDLSKVDGKLFGSLLEAAALCGADLSRLVSSIPQGMNIEGLRPRLVAAVADYRLKLKMNEAAAENGRNERINLLRELEHRSRRGMRCSVPSQPLAQPKASAPKSTTETVGEHGDVLRRPKDRPNRYPMSASLPIQ